MARIIATIAVAIWAVCMSTADAGALRGQQAQSRNDAALAPLGLVLAANGSTTEFESRVANMTEALRPVYLALPRSAEGYLDASAVRYLLHRYFIDRDGWFVQGSDASGETANSSLPEVVLHGGALARELSERLAARGLSLREVAVLATGLETLAHTEMADRLHAAFSIVKLSHREEHATEEELGLVLDVYLQLYTLGFDYERTTWRQVNATRKKIYDYYPMWDQLKMWIHEVRSEVLASIPEQRGTFSELARVLEEVQHRYGRWQDQQCLSVKKALQEHATPGTGRVPLSTFYSVDLPGGWQPSETRVYLKHMGALDESDSSNPTVVVPNYFDTPTSCANPSKYYAVCCISECEALLGHLERKLGSPNALPEQIAGIIEQLPSSTVEAPRTLPAQLAKRLESIAALHGGHAPLHGRLFRQWMHHAFPSECSYPALSSTQQFLTPVEFMQQTGQQAFVDPADLQAHLQRPTKEATSVAIEPFTFAADMLSASLPWTDEEELFITCQASSQQPVVRKTRASFKGIARAVLLLAVGASLALVLARARRNSRTPLLPSHTV